VANNVIYIQDNARKRLTANMVEKITGVAGSTVSAITSGTWSVSQEDFMRFAASAGRMEV